MLEIQSSYNYKVVRQFTVMSVIWGIVGMLVGVIIAAQLVWPELNVGFLHFGRLRPLHTNAVIFAFGGCGLFATSYYVVQRTCQTKLFGGPLIPFTFWGWQIVIVAAAIKVMMRSSSSRSRILSIACSSNDGVALVERRSALGHHSFDGSKPVV